jgi:hypothetical protein
MPILNKIAIEAWKPNICGGLRQVIVGRGPINLYWFEDIIIS